MILKYLKRIIYGYRATQETYLDYLRNKGAKVGEGVTIFAPTRTMIDIGFSYMLEIGDEVRITEGVTILNHDYSWSVCKKKIGEIIGGIGRVKIGNNVFIGMKSTILMNTEIGNNVIIGANSLVSGNIESNSVYAENPAKRIRSIDEYIEKRKKKQLEEAKEIVRSYYNRFHKRPDKSIMPAYFWLFEKNLADLDPVFIDRMSLCGNYEMSVEAFERNSPIYNSYDEFLDDVLKGE